MIIWRMSSPMEVCKSGDMISCAIEWQPSEAAFDLWPLRVTTERASQAKRPYSVPPPQCLMRCLSLSNLPLCSHGAEWNPA